MNFGLVNTHYAEIDGVGTVGSLDKLQFVPEVVVIAAPATAVVGIIDEAGKGGSARADYYRRPRPWRGLAGGRSRTRRAKIWNAVSLITSPLLPMPLVARMAPMAQWRGMARTIRSR